ncbi:hypothetical protein ERJ75_001669200 [Trypanosoma vivax]|uniref:Uncharacterized protein n=1 Tax=Trypanosoma vivax (strain Y486) TaxID=1055687 RepID=G0U8L2_TRYVY|nr:hypothetical protein TRVL_00477 [Trypanosoma vivax]KAH8604958.1 hypothetical protein ERJ75_001669200 [Trypanosoma vivax]CCC53938.1 conserved hypothetical protein [Trypanosoma vivax Y486]
MSSDKVGSTAGGFIRNFFALLGTDQASAEHEEQVVGKDTCSPLPLAPDQRLAFAKVLPEWVRLLTAAPRAKKRKPSRPTDVSGRRTFPRSESFFDGTLMDQWLELPHLAPIPSPWVKPCTSASYSSRHRLLQNLQRRYELVERGDRKGNKSQCFVRDFLRTLNLHRDTTEQSIGRTEFLCVVEELVDGTSTEEGNEKEPPLALLAELLFSEWCVAGGGDASFASTRVALQVIEADLRAYEKEGGEDPTKVIHSHNEGAVVDGEENSIVVGTLAALACAHPMTPDTQTSDVASTTGFRKRSAVRSGSAFSALELDDEVEEDGDVEEDEFDDSASKENTGVENAKGVRKLGAIVEESTCAFNVPLASVVLTTYRVTEHGNNPSSVTEQHVKLEDGEIYSRRGALRWFTVGNSKRHRNFLESKSKFLVGGPAFDISSAHKKYK